MEHNVPFWFKQMGAKFKKGSKVYHIERKDQMSQAEKAGVNYRLEVICLIRIDRLA